MSDYYDFSLEHIRQLLAVAGLRKMHLPDGFESATIGELQKCYNGIGPDRWCPKFRRAITRLLEFLEAPALIHDWEYSQPVKSYGRFTAANWRLLVNSWKDGRFRVGLAAAVLCQLFGYSGYKEGAVK